MSSVLPRWVKLWLVVSTVLCLLDVLYTMLRPRTLRDGDLWWLMYPWHWYSDIDLRYADTKDPVTCATGRLMIIELGLNIIALLLDKLKSPHAVTVTFASSCFVFEKTLLYLALFIRPPAGSPSYLTDVHFLRELFVFWIPDAVWVVLPLMVMFKLWPTLTGNAAAKLTDKKFA